MRRGSNAVRLASFQQLSTASEDDDVRFLVSGRIVSVQDSPIAGPVPSTGPATFNIVLNWFDKLEKQRSAKR